MAWQKFNRRSASRTTSPTVTIQRRGTLSLSGPAVALLMGSKEYPDKIDVELLYDPERELVGISRASPENPNPHMLRRQGTSDVYLVAGSLFCSYYDIDTSIARRYRAKLHDGILGIKLADNYAIVGRRTKDGDTGDTNEDHQGARTTSKDVGDQDKQISASDPWSE